MFFCTDKDSYYCYTERKKLISQICFIHACNAFHKHNHGLIKLLCPHMSIFLPFTKWTGRDNSEIAVLIKPQHNLCIDLKKSVAIWNLSGDRCHLIQKRLNTDSFSQISAWFSVLWAAYKMLAVPAIFFMNCLPMYCGRNNQFWCRAINVLHPALSVKSLFHKLSF